MSVELRLCNPDDLEVLRNLGMQTFTETFGSLNTAANLAAYLESAFDPARLRAELSHPLSAFWLLLVDGCDAGYIKVNVGEAQNDLKEPDLLELERIYVRSQFQGRGLGRLLLEKALELARAQHKRAVWLGVWDQNFTALAFYQKLGFRVIGSHAFVLGDDHQTDYVMMRELSGVG